MTKSIVERKSTESRFNSPVKKMMPRYGHTPNPLHGVVNHYLDSKTTVQKSTTHEMKMTTLLTKSLFSDLTRAVAVKACTRSQITSGLLMSEKTFSYLLDPLDRYLAYAFRFPGIPRIKRDIVDLAGSIPNSNYKNGCGPNGGHLRNSSQR